ncbi:MAG: helix-turn-helix transcriptional regulator [Paludibacteraceae bacterium]|nr:helix-turn-helix transcriptional regulator [Eubacterium sp.]MBR1630483.1 helix-turn-helix transcriptional regulator [Paludibacteraceae bacterium]
MSDVIAVINNRIKERGATIVFVAKRANMKTDILSKTLNGNRNLKADELVNLCQVLDLTLDDFDRQTVNQ